MTKTNKGLFGLTLGALGVVFGDIGTSPLYAVQAVFSPLGQNLAVNQVNVHGIISLIFWAITLVVSVKYIGFVMRADNEGESGIMALVARIKSSKLGGRAKWFYIFLGLAGVSLFYGDSAITPAISVLSAVEGLKVVAPQFSHYTVPITLVILSLLFGIQKYGTALIGRLFGPVMLAWFLTIAAGGVWQIWQHPDILASLSPLAAMNFISHQPVVAFVAMGAVVLVVTGAEALYADMGHFGRAPIAKSWFFLVFPSLILCYMGQGALLLISPSLTSGTFMFLFPESVRFTVLLLATVSTLIASQAVISGAFSLTRQAVRLNFLPRMTVRHTSNKEAGQIYLPFINIVLFMTVVFLVIYFGSSERLASAYGIAVSGTMAIDTILFVMVMRTVWKKSIGYAALALSVFLSVDLIFVFANMSKLVHGGWFPVILAAATFILFHTWLKGQKIVANERKAMEGKLQTFIDKVRANKMPIVRVPGYAVYIGHHADLAPLALHASVEELHELHEKVVIVTVDIATAAHVPENERAEFDDLGYNDGISSLKLTFGFHDSLNIPRTLKQLRTLSSELDFDPSDVSYFVSQSKIVPSHRHNMSGWRKSLFAMMARNAESASDYYKLPVDRTVEMSSLIEL